MSDRETVEKHPSYGVLCIHRVQGGNAPLFGSSIRHHNRVRLTIRRAELVRNLSYGRRHAVEELIEVEMSPVQWAEAITTMNTYPGSPCTILHVGAESIPECPYRSERELIHQELDAKTQECLSDIKEMIGKTRELLAKKTILVSDRKAILESLEALQAELACNVPFIHKQFDEAMEKTVCEAKGEIEAFYTHAVMRAGEAALAAGLTQAPALLEDKSHG